MTRSKDYSLLKAPVDNTAKRAVILGGLQAAGLLLQEAGNSVQNTAARFSSSVSSMTLMGIRGFMAIPEASLASTAPAAEFTVERDNVSQLRPGQKLMAHDIT
jgi:hypothetical protein